MSAGTRLRVRGPLPSPLLEDSKFRIRYDSAYPSTVGIDRRRFIKFGAAGLTLLDFAGSSTVAAP